MLFSADPRPPSREGLLLRRRWGRREFVPFDEMASLSDPGVTLTSGATLRVPAAQREAAVRALAPPPATGAVEVDGAALAQYVTGGAWSPGRAAAILLAMAAATDASDVHIEAGEAGYRLRFRVSGALSDFADLPATTGRRLLAALKHASGCLPYRSDVVQEGRIPREGVAADVRASFLPTALGERAALRLFGRLRSLDQLGLGEDSEARLEALLAHPSGLVLIAGPSGGGKTTTVYAALAHIASRRDGAHLSIEDPVEQRLRLAGVPVDQIELCPERGLTAEVALVGALRQDIDVVALGEIRTEGEATLALRAAHTGRLVVAGVHAGSPAEARRRMLDLGVEEAVLDDTLRGVLHQRLETGACTDHDEASCAPCGGTGRVRRPVCRIWEPS